MQDSEGKTPSSEPPITPTDAQKQRDKNRLEMPVTFSVVSAFKAVFGSVSVSYCEENGMSKGRAR